jgi:hypothetical protein
VEVSYGNPTSRSSTVDLLFNELRIVDDKPSSAFVADNGIHLDLGSFAEPSALRLRSCFIDGERSSA